MLLILSIVLLPACSAEPTQLVTDDPVAVISIAPKVDTLRPGSSQQFVASAMSRLGKAQSILTTWSTTGGTVSQTGHFEAGDAEGTFLVIASCLCGLADTARVTVEAEPVAAAGLRIQVEGLPEGVSPTIAISGPAGLTRSVTASTDLAALPSGVYAVVAGRTTKNGDIWIPTPDSLSLELSAPATDTVVIAYQQAGAGGPLQHPRVWMTPTRIDHLKAQMAANATRWQRVKLYADQQVAKGATIASLDRISIPSLCAAYLATDVQGYADRAALLLAAYAVPATDMRRDSGYDFRFVFPVVTMGLDWCYNGLPVAVRQQTAKWLMDWADWVWPETNPTIDGGQNKRYSIDRPTNNYWWGFMMTGPAGLAASDDDPRGAFHATLGHKRWAEAQAQFFTTAGVGGSSVEGTGYDVAWYVGRFADAYLTAGQPVTDPWLEASLHWRLHSTMPGGKFLIPLGDQARVSAGVTYTYDRMRALAMLDATSASPVLRGQVRSWLDWIGQPPHSEGGTGTLTDELLHFNPSQSPVSLNTLPLSYVTGNKLVYRTGWSDPNATVFAFDGSPIIEGHQSFAANNLLIWKGSYWISGGANIFSQSGIRHETRYNNTLTVPGTNGEQLTYTPSVNTVGIVASSETPNLVVVRGQAAGNYGRNGNHPVTDYLRTVAYLPDHDAFVVVDRVTVVSAALPLTIRWHAKTAPPITGNRFTLTNPNGDQRCVGEAWSRNTLVVGSEPQSIGQNGALSSYAVTLTTSGAASDIIVTVLQCAAGPAPSPASATISFSEAIVTVAGKRVIVPLAESLPVRVE